jgi:hypothetical protein
MSRTAVAATRSYSAAKVGTAAMITKDRSRVVSAVWQRRRTLWFEVDAFQSAVRRAELFGTEVVRLRKLRPSFVDAASCNCVVASVHVTPRLSKAPSGALAERSSSAMS